MPFSASALASLGVPSWHLPPGTAASAERLAAIRAHRGYGYEDTLQLSRDLLGDAYATKLAIFYTEHTHSDEEVRYVTSGGGYFDVRLDRSCGADAPAGSWVRVAARPGVMLVLPAGVYHRFTLDDGERIEATRLFVGEPVWTPLNRSEASTAEHPARQAYLASQAAVAVA